MDLLKTILLYMTMTFVSSVQVAPDPATVSELLNPTPAPTAIVMGTVAPTATPVPTPSPTPVPTPAITPNKAYKTLRVGDKGEDIRKMQARLAELGYYDGDIDGRFGNQTRRAVERFQYNQGLSVDGIAGRATQTVLYESEDVVPAPVETTPAPTVETTNGPSVAATELTETAEPTFVPTAEPTVAPDATEAPATEPTATPDTGALPTAVVLADMATTAPDAPEAPATEPTAAPDTGALPTAVVLADMATTAPDATAEPAAAAPTDTPASEETTAPAESPEPSAEPYNAPAPMTDHTFRLADATATLAKPDAEGEPLRPLKFGEDVYVPFIAILQDAGVVTVPGVTGERDEVAFAILDDVFRLSYVLDNAGDVTAIEWYKNEQPQIMTLRQAYVVDGLLYLPINVTMEVTGVRYTLDEAALCYIVDLPTSVDG